MASDTDKNPSDDELFGDIASAETQPIVDRDAPEFDSIALKAAFPEVARLDFAQRPEDGLIICRLVMRDLETTKDVDIGFTLPDDTAGLIEAISSFLHATIDTEALAEAEAALDLDLD